MMKPKETMSKRFDVKQTASNAKFIERRRARNYWCSFYALAAL